MIQGITIIHVSPNESSCITLKSVYTCNVRQPHYSGFWVFFCIWYCSDCHCKNALFIGVYLFPNTYYDIVCSIHIVIKYFLGLNLHFNTNKDKGSNKRSADDCRVLRILWRRTTTMLTPSYIPLPLSHSSPYHHKMQTKKPVLAPNMVPNTNI